MGPSVHAHSILQMVLEAEEPMRLKEFVDRVNQRFGSEARFHSCSAQGMDLDRTIQFLLDRRKVSISEGRLHPGSSAPCGTGE